MGQADIPKFDERRIRDPVHGLIVFRGDNETDRIAWALLNAPEMQRLRRIKQLGFSEFVYPGASHTRFAHSVGVYHLARQLIQLVNRRSKRRNPWREKATLLAALVHDIGHGPFSHVFEHVTKAIGQPRNHEDWGTEIVTGDTDVGRILRRVDRKLPEEIATLISAEEAADVYATIVSSQFDADRLDYIQRDRIMTGVQFGHIDIDWLLDCLRISKVTIRDGEGNSKPEACLCLNHKGIPVAEEYIEARFRLYTNVYMHKTTRAAEKMLESAIHKIASRARHGKGASGGRKHSALGRFLASANPPIADYLALDDTVVWASLNQYRNEADQTVATMAARLFDRRLYKCFDLGPLLDPASAHEQLARFRDRVGTILTHGRQVVPPVLEDDASVTGYKWYDFADSRGAQEGVCPTHQARHDPRRHRRGRRVRRRRNAQENESDSSVLCARSCGHRSARESLEGDPTMKPEDIAVGVVALNGGRLVGRTRFQKTAYLLDACGMNSGLSFEYHYYGPYSFAFAEGWDSAIKSSGMHKEDKPGKHWIPYSVFTAPADSAPKCLGSMSASDAREKLEIMKSRSDVVIELAATLHFLGRRPDIDDADLAVRRRKPIKATPENMRKAHQLLEKLGLTSRPVRQPRSMKKSASR
jgi:uncharacterized protein